MPFVRLKIIHALLLAVLVVGGAGLLIHGWHMADSMSAMANQVPAAAPSGCCQVIIRDNPTMLNALIPAKNDLPVAALIILVLAAAQFLNSNPKHLLFVSKSAYYEVQNFLLRIFDYLLRAFSQGLLNPKIFLA